MDPRSENRSDSEKPPTSSASSRKRQGALFRFPRPQNITSKLEMAN